MLQTPKPSPKERAIAALRGLPGHVDAAFRDARRFLWVPFANEQERGIRYDPDHMAMHIRMALTNLKQRGVLDSYELTVDSGIKLRVVGRKGLRGYIVERHYDPMTDTFISLQNFLV